MIDFIKKADNVSVGEAVMVLKRQTGYTDKLGFSERQDERQNLLRAFKKWGEIYYNRLCNLNRLGGAIKSAITQDIFDNPPDTLIDVLVSLDAIEHQINVFIYSTPKERFELFCDSGGRS